MASTADFRNGLSLELDGDLFSIVSFQHVKPGKGGAFVRTKLRNIRSGRIVEKTFNAGVKVKLARIERHNAQFLYHDGRFYHFMDQENFETHSLEKNVIEGAKWLAPEVLVQLLIHQESGKILGCELPPSLILEVVAADDGAEGNTVNKALKSVELNSGAVIHVPLFIQKGDSIKIDTRTGKYIDRVKKN